MYTDTRQKSAVDDENNWSQHEDGTMKTENEEGCCGWPSEEGASGAVFIFNHIYLLSGKKADTLFWQGKSVDKKGSKC